MATPLGPSLFRINAILAASATPFEEVRDQLAKDRALEEAQRQIHEDTAHLEDLIAGGATLEEIASETVMQLGHVALNSETRGGIADDPAFREAALEAEVGTETDLIELDGGGLATLRVEAIEPPAVIPLAEIRDRVAADWTAARTADALGKLAVGYIGELDAGLDFAALAERLGRAVAHRRPADPRRHRRRRAAGPRRRRLRRGRRGRGHPPRRRRRDPRQAHRRSRPSTRPTAPTPRSSTTSGSSTASRRATTSSRSTPRRCAGRPA